jgi:hypothetical protein
MRVLKDEIESTNRLYLPNFPRWINLKRAEERYNNNEIAYLTVIIKVRSKSITDSLIVKGLKFKSKKHSIKLFLEIKIEDICSKYSKFGYNSYKAY